MLLSLPVSGRAIYRCCWPVDPAELDPLRDQPEQGLVTVPGLPTLLSQSIGNTTTAYTYILTEVDYSFFEILSTIAISSFESQSLEIQYHLRHRLLVSARVGAKG